MTVANTGNTILTVSSISYPAGFSGVFSGQIATGSSANVTVTFVPTAVTNYSGTVTVNSDATSGANTMPPPTASCVSTNTPPAFSIGPLVTNAVLQADKLFVVLADTPAVFLAAATNADGTQASIQWEFGNGATASGGVAEHTYTNCGPFAANAVATDGLLSNTAPLTVSVACQFSVTNLQMKVNFAKTGQDTAKFQGVVDLGESFVPTDSNVLLDVGGASLPFVLNKSGKGTNSQGTCQFTFNKKTALWKVTANFKKGTWRDPWVTYGLTNAPINKPGIAVTVPVVIAVGNDSFMDEKGLIYTATVGESSHDGPPPFSGQPTGSIGGNPGSRSGAGRWPPGRWRTRPDRGRVCCRIYPARLGSEPSVGLGPVAVQRMPSIVRHDAAGLTMNNVANDAIRGVTTDQTFLFVPGGTATPTEDDGVHVLVLQAGGDSVARVELGPAPITLGRSEEADVRLLDPQVSKKHCRLFLDQDRLEVTDLGSTNGTMVDQQRVQGTVLLPVGGRLHVGRRVYRHELRSRREIEKTKELESDLQKACAYVQALLPPPRSTGPVRTDWCFLPCSILGGDAFGYHNLDNDRLALYLLDVCGHGAAAAMHSVSVINVLRQQALPAADFGRPDEVLQGLNEAFDMERHHGLYFTLWYGVYRSRPPLAAVRFRGASPGVAGRGRAAGTRSRSRRGAWPSAPHRAYVSRARRRSSSLGAPFIYIVMAFSKLSPATEKTGTWTVFGNWCCRIGCREPTSPCASNAPSRVCHRRGSWPMISRC